MLALISLALATVLTLGGAGAQTSALAAAAESLRSDPVYVETGSGVLSDSEVDDLRDDIAASGRAIYVALLRVDTVEAAGGIDNALRQLRADAGLTGTYVLGIDGEIRTGSTNLPTGAAADMLAAALNAKRGDGRYAVLSDFVSRVGAFSASGSGSTGATGETGDDGSSEGDGDGGGSLMPLVLVGGAVAGGVYLVSRSRKTNQVRAEQRVVLQGAQQDLQAELSVLADDVLRLEPEIAVHPDARPDYEAAVSRFRWLEASIPQIDSPDDPPRIQRAMTEARYAMARAQAIVRGLEPPPPPAELTHEGRHGEPAIEIDEDDPRRSPRYAGYGGGWYGGGFFGGNDLFTGIILGSMLGGGGFGGFGWGGGYGNAGDGQGSDGGDNEDGDGGGWGDFGGGDFDGGGDFGGGDFGGGDW